MDFNKLAHTLTLLKSGLDELDSQCTQQSHRCMQLRQEVNQQQKHRKGLEQKAAAATDKLHEQQESVEDLGEVLKCVKGQAASAESNKERLQVRWAQQGLAGVSKTLNSVVAPAG